ncbi:MAG: MASE1 domain-containing protein [bacterium]|nr:MASE1 domain-containing protein [bacterium]
MTIKLAGNLQTRIAHFAELPLPYWKAAALTAKITSIAIVYILAALFGLQFEPVGGFATFIWPPSGIALAAVLLWGIRVWPGIFLGAFVANWITGAAVPAAIGIAFGNTLEAIAAFAILRRFKFNHAFERTRDATWFIATAAISPIIAATMGPLALSIAHNLSPVAWWEAWYAWWIGDALGMMIFAPLILIWTVRPRWHPLKRPLAAIELIWFAWIVTVIAVNVFTGRIGSNTHMHLPLAHLAFIPLVWATFRFGRHGVVATVTVISFFAVAGALAGAGPFARETQFESLFFLNLFIATLSGTGLILTATETERRHQNADLKTFNHTLEAMAQARLVALQEREYQYGILIESAPDIIAIIDANGIIKSLNTAFEKLTDWPRTAWIGKHFSRLMHPDEMRAVVAHETRAHNGRALIPPTEYRVLRKDGSWLDIEALSRPINLVNADSGQIVIARSIGERKKIEAERAQYAATLETKVVERTCDLENTAAALAKSLATVEQEKAKADAILESILDGVIEIDRHRRITFINEAAANMLRLDPITCKGRPLDEAVELVTPENAPHPAAPIQKAIAEGIPTSTTPPSSFAWHRKDGSIFPIALTVSPIRLAGVITGALIVFRDITKGRAIDRAKNEYISFASHELRTPLSLIALNAQLLLSAKHPLQPSEQHECIRETYEASLRMSEIIETLLNISRIESGLAVIEHEPIALQDLVAGLLAEIAPRSKLKNVRFKTAIPDDMPSVTADKKLLGIVLQNLLTNAVKYNMTGGSVTIGATHDPHEIIISVKDTGIGIPQDQQGRIFQKLYRTEKAKEIEREGMGLGLYLSRIIIEKLGGRIWLDSAENEGSTFFVAIPTHQKS